MCGFVAVFAKQDRPIPGGVIEHMTDDIVHRGPDDVGFWSEDWFELGFRRLSILDLSERGHQPMVDPTGNYVIVFNGEVYNFAELREKLEHQGVRFHSSGDTEVVLQAYIHWGEACLAEFIGMFAFIIVKISTREVFIARDQLGIKPLYYVESQDFFCFSSEIKAFRHVTDFELNHEALYEQLVFRYVAGESTPFRHVRKLLPGSCWHMRQGASPCQKVYYDVTHSLKLKQKVEKKGYLSTLEDGFRQSIQLHTASDVGFNVQLSGGVDSSFITAALTEEQPLDTFSIVFEDEQWDESKYQRLVTERYGTRHHEFLVDDTLFSDALEKATWHMDVPIVHLGCVLLMLLCQQSVQNSKVILTGEGADELLCGYTRYRLNLKTRTALILQKFGLSDRILFALPHFAELGRFLGNVIDTQVFFDKPTMLTCFQELPQNTTYRDEMVQSQDSYVAKLLAHDQTCYLASLLDRQDKMSMAASVEARVPFCNPRLFDMVNPVPEALKLRGGMPKYLLKKIAEPYLDHDLLYRRKNGLVIPLKQWLQKGPLSERLTLLTDKTARERGFYNIRNLEVAVNDHRQGIQEVRFLSNILMFEIWMRMFIDSGGCYRKL